MQAAPQKKKEKREEKQICSFYAAHEHRDQEVGVEANDQRRPFRRHHQGTHRGIYREAGRHCRRTWTISERHALALTCVASLANLAFLFRALRRCGVETSESLLRFAYLGPKLLERPFKSSVPLLSVVNNAIRQSFLPY